MSTEERDELNPEEEPGVRRESEDVEGHAAKSVKAVDDGDDSDSDDDVEAHSSKNR
jgi:hypothetical protein